jgi:hypothetical protein
MKTAAASAARLEALMVATRFWLVCSVGTFCTALAAGALAASYLSFNQDSEVNDGTWNARIDGDAKTARQGRVVIENFAGEWREIGPRRAGDPCRGTKPFPITVQRSNERALEFTAWAEQVSKCPNFALSLKVVDERTLVGTVQALDQLPIDGSTAGGREVRLTREPVKRKTPR